jgi:hypothetical protein
MQGFYFTTRVTTQNGYIFDDGNNKDDDDDEGECVCLRLKFEKK